MVTPSERPGSTSPSADAGESPQVRGFVVDVVSLLREPGTRLEVHIDERLTGLGTSAATADTARGSLVVESMSDSVSANGVLEVGWTGACRRCLDPAEGVVEVAIGEVYERHPVDGETYELAGDRVDLRAMVEEQILLSLPLAPLCGTACAGPAPETFPTSVESDDVANGDGDDATGDPRWAVLDELVFDEPAGRPTTETSTVDHPSSGPDSR